MVFASSGGLLGTFGSPGNRAVYGDGRSVLVPPGLEPWISGIGVGTIARGDGWSTVIEAPDPAAALLLRAGTGGDGDLVVVGPRTRALYHLGRPGPMCVKVRFQLGRAGWLLDRSASELVDRVVPVSGRWAEAADRLSAALADLGSEPQTLPGRPALERLRALFLGVLPPAPDRDRSRSDVAHAAARLLAAGAGRPAGRLPEVARELEVSERRLRDLFGQAVGMSPKPFARLDRVRTVLAGLHRGDLARLAVEAGYYDQSHMTAEFRRVMGVPPHAFAVGRLPPAAACHP
jgi:AraC-like DNA-binding protein